MKNLILVIGRSGAGKDTLVRYAQADFGAKAVPSYTDRPMRPNETDGIEHTFLTREQFDELLKTEQVFAYTKIGETGYRYCTTVKMLKEFDSDTVFYVIDPAGYYFCEKFKDEFNMKVVYVCADRFVRENRANRRNGETATWLKRSADEDEQFTAFEKAMPWDALVQNDGDMEQAQKKFVILVKSIMKSK